MNKLLRDIQCLNCKHLFSTNDGTWKCAAFPEITSDNNELIFQNAIPQEILDGTFDHTKPYPGDNGIQYEPLDD